MPIIIQISSFVLEKPNTKIFSTLIIENHKIFAISKHAIEYLNTGIEEVKIRLSVQVSVIM